MTPKSALCAFLGCDSLRDMEDSYRYQPKPRERFPLYTCDEWVYTYGAVRPEGEWEADRQADQQRAELVHRWGGDIHEALEL